MGLARRQSKPAETDADHRFILCIGNVHNTNNRRHGDPIGRTSWEFAGGDPEADPVWRAHK